MEKFFIIANSSKDAGLKVTRQVESFLKNKGKWCAVKAETRTDAAEIPEDVDCIIVLGGDGTLLRAARAVVNKQIPLLGINLGTLGYLAEIDSSSVEPALSHLILDEYTLEKRMMLNGKVYHNKELIMEDVALNDIVIGREGPLRVIRFHNYVNGEYLNSYTADGIIISTATGSTGYSLSAGGPIVSPESSILLMTPIAPHTLNTRSVILPGEDEITVEVGEGTQKGEAKAVAYFDGENAVPMTDRDKVVIRRSQKDTRIIKISNISFLEVLRQKMKS